MDRSSCAPKSTVWPSRKKKEDGRIQMSCTRSDRPRPLFRNRKWSWLTPTIGLRLFRRGCHNFRRQGHGLALATVREPNPAAKHCPALHPQLSPGGGGGSLAGATAYLAQDLGQDTKETPWCRKLRRYASSGIAKLGAPSCASLLTQVWTWRVFWTNEPPY